MLIDKNRISVRVQDDETGGTVSSLICLAHEGDTFRLQLLLYLSDIGKLTKRLRVFIPSRIEGQRVVFEHALEQADRATWAFEDQPTLLRFAAKSCKAGLFVKKPADSD